MADILLTTKIHIPPLHGNLVNRTHLIQRLNDGVAQSRLTLISAPAGYGKSTLPGEWVSQINIPVAWLSLERGENVPARFWYYFITALNAIPQLRLAGIRASISQVLRSSQSVSMEAELIKLVNDFSSLAERVVLVLDDLHNHPGLGAHVLYGEWYIQTGRADASGAAHDERTRDKAGALCQRCC